MRPKSNDLRERIVARREAGDSAASISKLFGVSIRSVQRYVKRQRERGTVTAEKLGKPEGSKLDLQRERISQWIQEEPGLTLEQISDRLKEQQQLQVHHTTVMRVLRRWGYRFKKK